MKTFLSLTMRFRPDITTWSAVHDREQMRPGDVAIITALVPKPQCFVLYPCCGDLVDHTDGQHVVGRDELMRIHIRPSIACRGCGAHYIVQAGAIVEGSWGDPVRAAEWAARYPDPPRAGIAIVVSE